MGKPKAQRNIVGEHLRSIAIVVVAEKIRRVNELAKAYTNQQTYAMFGPEVADD